MFSANFLHLFCERNWFLFYCHLRSHSFLFPSFPFFPLVSYLFYTCCLGFHRSIKCFSPEPHKVFLQREQRCIRNPVKHLKCSFFTKINDFKPLTIFSKSSILDIWQVSEYVTGENKTSSKSFRVPQKMLWRLRNGF